MLCEDQVDVVVLFSGKGGGQISVVWQLLVNLFLFNYSISIFIIIMNRVYMSSDWSFDSANVRALSCVNPFFLNDSEVQTCLVWVSILIQQM